MQYPEQGISKKLFLSVRRVRKFYGSRRPQSAPSPFNIVEFITKPRVRGFFPRFSFISLVSFLDSTVRSKNFRFLRNVPAQKNGKKEPSGKKRKPREPKVWFSYDFNNSPSIKHRSLEYNVEKAINLHDQSKIEGCS